MPTCKGILSAVLVFCLVFHEAAVAQGSDGELSFEHSPEVIRDNARQGKYLPINVNDKPVSYGLFKYSRQISTKNKTAFAVVGVVVDSQADDGSGAEQHAHLQAVRSEVHRLVVGDEKTGDVGWAEEYGVWILGILAIKHDTDDRYFIVKDGERVAVPLTVGNILIAVNDHPLVTRESGALIERVDEIGPRLGEYLQDERHLLSHAEYMGRVDARLAELDDKIQRLDGEIQDLNVIEQVLDARRVENLLFIALLGGEELSSANTDNRQLVTSVFNDNGLPVDPQFRPGRLHDTLAPHLPKLWRRGCDAGDARSCHDLGFHYAEGRYLEQNIPKAQALYRSGCEGGYELACERRRDLRLQYGWDMLVAVTDGTCPDGPFCDLPGGQYINAIYTGSSSGIAEIDSALLQKPSNPLMSSFLPKTFLLAAAEHYLFSLQSAPDRCFDDQTKRLRFRSQSNQVNSFGVSTNGPEVVVTFRVDPVLLEVCKAVCSDKSPIGAKVFSQSRTGGAGDSVLVGIAQMFESYDCDSEVVRQFESNLASLAKSHLR